MHQQRQFNSTNHSRFWVCPSLSVHPHSENRCCVTVTYLLIQKLDIWQSYSGALYRNLHELDSKKQAKTPTSVLCKSNTFKANKLFQCDRKSRKENLVWSRTSSRCSYRLTPERRSWKLDEHKKHLQARQHLRGRREALNLGSAGTITHKCDSRVCDDEDSEVIVPPTPAGKSSATPRRRRQTDTSSSSLELGDGFNCKRTLLDQTHTSSQRGEAVLERSLDGSNDCLLDNESQTCDWSRDLFSDSVWQALLQIYFRNCARNSRINEFHANNPNNDSFLCWLSSIAASVITHAALLFAERRPEKWSTYFQH